MIIGICGYKGSGKSTVSEVAINLVRPVTLPFVRMGFSDPLYKMLIAMGVPEEVVYDKRRWNDPLDVLQGRTTRFACDTLGNDWGRDIIGKDVWGNIGIRTAQRLAHHGSIVIIDNVRYWSEFHLINAAGGTVIAFHNPKIEPDLTKPSEREIAGIQAGCGYSFFNFDNNLQETSLRFRALLDQIAVDMLPEMEKGG